MQKSEHELSSWLTLLLLAIIWGSSFILIKYALFQNGKPALTGVEVGALRMAIASLSLLPITLKHWTWYKTHWKPLLVVGFFGNGLPAFLFAIAQTKIDSSLSGMLNSATPLFTLVIGLALFGTQAKRAQLLGVLLGLAGTVALISESSNSQSPSDPVYAGLALLGSLFYGISVNTIKNKLYAIPTLAIAGLALAFAGIPSALYLAFSDFPNRLSVLPEVQAGLGYVTALAVVGTAGALVLFNRLVERTDAVFSSSVTYLLPVVAIFWGVMDGETISAYQLICVGIILFSVLLVGRNKK